MNHRWKEPQRPLSTGERWHIVCERCGAKVRAELVRGARPFTSRNVEVYLAPGAADWVEIKRRPPCGGDT